MRKALFVLRKITVAVASTGLLLSLAACGSGNSSDTLLVGATSVPHAEILNYVKQNLADKAGLKLEVKEFSNYEQLNPALNDGQLDANYFQTRPYLEEFTKEKGAKLDWVADIHVEPMGVYSKKVKALKDLKQGATVSLPSDPPNGSRALKLLAANGLITLKQGASDATVTEKDVTANPKNIKWKPADAATLPRQLPDVDASVINGNYALEGGLTPASDALAAEKAEGSPYANGIVTKGGEGGGEQVKKLVELLKGPEVKKFIDEKFKGSVVPSA